MTIPPPSWQLPPGVVRGNWEYVHSREVTDHYDPEFAAEEASQFDLKFVRQCLSPPGLVVDLGCGTGRLLVPLARAGFRGLGVDLSPLMLARLGQKIAAERLPIERVRANLVQLSCLRDEVADYVLCMFSTWGMIQGREHRRQALAHMRRIVKPGGRLVLHVHNRWHNLWSPEGRRWLLANCWQACVRRQVELGDKQFDYRDVRSMFLHLFTRGELCEELTRANWRIEQVVPLNDARWPLSRPWFLGRVRAGGWIVLARRGD